LATILSTPGIPPVINQPLYGAGGFAGNGGLAGTAPFAGGSGGTQGPDGQIGDPGGSILSTWKQGDEEDEAGDESEEEREARKAGKYKAVAFIDHVLSFADRKVSAHNTLLAPKKDNFIAQAGAARIRVAKGAVAFVVNNGREVEVLSLHDNTSGDVKVLVDGQEIALRAGEQLVLTNSESTSLSDANLSNLAIRRTNKHLLGNGQVAFVSEFSIPAALQQLQAVSRLNKSNVAHDRATYAKILKNAAILQTVGAQKGSYRRVVSKL
jgi:hypothetical protein